MSWNFFVTMAWLRNWYFRSHFEKTDFRLNFLKKIEKSQKFLFPPSLKIFSIGFFLSLTNYILFEAKKQFQLLHPKLGPQGEFNASRPIFPKKNLPNFVKKYPNNWVIETHDHTIGKPFKFSTKMVYYIFSVGLTVFMKNGQLGEKSWNRASRLF